jgi:hypothetical protein
MSGLFNEIDRFTEQNQGNAACSFCGQHAREKLVSDGVTRKARVFRTNLYIHMEGWVEICEWCIEEASAAIGAISPAHADELRLYAADWAEKYAELAQQYEDKTDAVALLARELAEAEDRGAAREKRAYDKGWEDGLHQENVPEVPDAGA